MIINASAGGAKRLTVVGGTTMPSSPRANTLWINSVATLGKLAIQAAAPTMIDGAALSTGDVWIRLSVTGRVAVSHKSIAYIVNHVLLYSGSAWVAAGASYYNGSTWVIINPLAYGGCIAWLDASQLSGISNGGTVASFTDMSGSGHHFVQTTEALKPSYQTGIFGLLPAVLFAGKYLQCPMTIVQPCTVIVVTRKTAWNGSNNEVLLRDNAATTSVWYVDGVTRKLSIISGGTAIVSTSALALNANVVQSTVLNGIASKQRVNGVEVTGSPGTLGFASPVNIGAGYNGGELWYGYIAELIILSKALTSDELETIRQYLIQKWWLN